MSVIISSVGRLAFGYDAGVFGGEIVYIEKAIQINALCARHYRMGNASALLLVMNDLTVTKNLVV